MARPSRYSADFRACALRLVAEARPSTTPMRTPAEAEAAYYARTARLTGAGRCAAARAAVLLLLLPLVQAPNVHVRGMGLSKRPARRG